MDLHFDTPNYHVDILKISNYKFQLEVYHKETSETRIYDIDNEIKKVDFDSLSARVNIIFNDETYLHLNFESESIIIGDFFEQYTEEYIDAFMAHDFMEEENEVFE